jgi:hypothetical protein
MLNFSKKGEKYEKSKKAYKAALLQEFELKNSNFQSDCALTEAMKNAISLINTKAHTKANNSLELN